MAENLKIIDDADMVSNIFTSKYIPALNRILIRLNSNQQWIVYELESPQELCIFLNDGMHIHLKVLINLKQRLFVLVLKYLQ